MKHINTKEELIWWNSLDMECKWLSKLWFSMYGSCEQRVSQLFIIRYNNHFKKINK